MASYKDYKSISAARKAGSMYYENKQGKKMLAVTKEQLDAWKKKNKGKYKGSALTAWANNKGKNISDSSKTKSGAPKKSPFPKTRPSSGSIKVEVLLPGSDKTLNQVFDRMSREKNLPKPKPTEIRLSTKNLNKFLKNPDSLTSIEKSRLKKTLKRANIKIPKGL